MKTKVYKLRHKPTGLFYQPGKCNLSEKGKVYTKAPSKRWPRYYVELPKDSKVYKKYKDILDPLNTITGRVANWKWMTTISMADWEIVVYDVEYNISPSEVQ